MERLISHYRLAIEESLLAGAPEDKDLRHSVASSFNTIGLVLRSSGRLDGALREFERELRTRQALSDADPDNFTYRLRLSVAHTHIGLVLAAQGKTADAAGALERALGLLRELDARDPTNRAWQREIASGHANLAAVRLASGHAGAARPLLDRAVRTMETLVAGDPTNTGWQRDLAEFHRTRAATALTLGDLAAAAVDGATALAMTSDLPGGDLQAARIASAAHAVLARVSDARGDAVLARRHWEQALESIPAAARTTRDYRVLDPLAIALLRLGRADEAASVVETLRAMGYRDPVFLAQIQTTGAV
jgi:tetratricopeptide (TPR) repeat protein